MRERSSCLGVILLLIGSVSWLLGQNVSQEAIRYRDRGVAAMNMAKSPSDYDAAINEFEQAARLAPDWPDIYYNLGVAQESAERFADAARSYRKYLELDPNAKDAEEIRSLINTLEFRAERERTLTTDDVAEIIASVGNEDIWEHKHRKDFDLVLFGAISRVGDSRIKIPRMLVSGSQGHKYEVVEQEGYQYIDVKGPVISFSLEGSWVGYPVVPPYRTSTEVFEITVLSRASVKVSRYSLWSTVQGTPIKNPTVSYEILRRGKGAEGTTGHVYPDVSNGWVANETAENATPRSAPEPKDINAKDQYGYTQLHMAAITDDRARAESAISQGADLEARDGIGYTPLHYAIKNGTSLGIAELLIHKGADKEAKNNHGQTPLHFAASEGKKDMAELLIAEGADVNSRDNTGQTPLHDAAEGGFPDVVKLLLEKGADINAKDKYGRTPLQVAESRKNTEVVDLLRSRGGQGQDAQKANQMPADHQRESGSDVSSKLNVRDQYGRTPLHNAASQGQGSLVGQLIADGADVSAKDNGGYTPLHLAVGFGQKAVAELLIAKGADINAKNGEGQTPLYSAAAWGQMAIVELLVSKGADIYAKDSDGLTPERIAEKNGHKDIADLLRKRADKGGGTQEDPPAALQVSIELSDKTRSTGPRNYSGSNRYS